MKLVSTKANMIILTPTDKNLFVSYSTKLFIFLGPFLSLFDSAGYLLDGGILNLAGMIRVLIFKGKCWIWWDYLWLDSFLQLNKCILVNKLKSRIKERKDKNLWHSWPAMAISITKFFANQLMTASLFCLAN